MLFLFILFVHAFPFTSVDNHQESLSEKISAAAARQGKPFQLQISADPLQLQVVTLLLPSPAFFLPQFLLLLPNAQSCDLTLSLFWCKPPPATNDPGGTTSSFSALWQCRQKSSCPPRTLTAHTSTISKEVLKHKIFKLTHYWGQKENTLRLALRCRTNSCSARGTPTLLASVLRKMLRAYTIENKIMLFLCIMKMQALTLTFIYAQL